MEPRFRCLDISFAERRCTIKKTEMIYTREQTTERGFSPTPITLFTKFNSKMFEKIITDEHSRSK